MWDIWDIEVLVIGAIIVNIVWIIYWSYIIGSRDQADFSDLHPILRSCSVAGFMTAILIIIICVMMAFVPIENADNIDDWDCEQDTMDVWSWNTHIALDMRKFSDLLFYIL